MEGEVVIVLGAGINGLSCATELQRQNPNRQVDLIAQVLPGDPVAVWSTGYSRCFFHCLKRAASSLEEKTFQHMYEISASTASQALNRFEYTQYFLADTIDQERVATLPNFRILQPDQLLVGAKHGFAFTSMSVMPDQLAGDLFESFARSGGRVFRGTVRHLKELLEAGAAPFARSTIVVCVGIGARSIGGIEDKSLLPMRFQVIKLRAPWMKGGNAFYDGDDNPSFFAIPMGNGDIVIGGKPDYDDWFALPRPEVTKFLLKQAETLCPELIPRDAPPDFDLLSLLVWEGCDLFGVRQDGPRLEATLITNDKGGSVPVVYNYGYGPAELQVSHPVSKAVANLVDGAIQQKMDIDITNSSFQSGASTGDARTLEVEDGGQRKEREERSVLMPTPDTDETELQKTEEGR